MGCHNFCPCCSSCASCPRFRYRARSGSLPTGRKVRSGIRPSAPGTADAVIGVATSRQPVNTAASALATTGATTTASAVGSRTKTVHSYSSASGVQRDSHRRIKRSESAKREFMRMTGHPHGRPGYVVDHVVPLKRGGCDCPSISSGRRFKSERQRQMGVTAAFLNFGMRTDGRHSTSGEATRK